MSMTYFNRAILLFILITSFEISFAQELINDKLNDVLLQGSVKLLKIKPALPDNYVYGNANMVEGCSVFADGNEFWGPSEVLKQYFENPFSLKEPIISFGYTKDSFQINSNRISLEDIVENLNVIAKNKIFLKTRKLNWGEYPVLELSFIENETPHTAIFVGFDGYVLYFAPIFPVEMSKNKANKFWKKFVENTIGLSI